MKKSDFRASQTIYAPTEWCGAGVGEKLRRKLHEDYVGTMFSGKGLLKEIVSIDDDISPGLVADISGKVRYNLSFIGVFLHMEVGDILQDSKPDAVNVIGTMFRPHNRFKIFVLEELDVGKLYNVKIEAVRYEMDGVFAVGRVL